MLRIRLDNLSKKFIKEWIIRGCTCEFESGQTYAVTGPNGSGKSTLAQIICGYTTPTSGEIDFTLNDKKIEIDQVYKQLTFASPYMELIEEFTLKEMVNFHFKFKTPVDGVSATDIPGLINLEKSANKQIKNFSSGMKQRLKLGLAFFSDCQLMIFDEPTTNLDEKGASWYTDQIQQLAKDRIIIICSNQKREYDFCTNVLNVMDWK